MLVNKPNKKEEILLLKFAKNTKSLENISKDDITDFQICKKRFILATENDRDYIMEVLINLLSIESKESFLLELYEKDGYYKNTIRFLLHFYSDSLELYSCLSNLTYKSLTEKSGHINALNKIIDSSHSKKPDIYIKYLKCFANAIENSHMEISIRLAQMIIEKSQNY